MLPAASVDSVLEFCNKVREAGGAKPLDALLPGIPEDAESCLIAKNLNFQCEVSPVLFDKGVTAKDAAVLAKANQNDEWLMTIGDRKTRDRIAESLNLTAVDLDDDRYAVVLPKKITNVARNFDRIGERYIGDANEIYYELVDEKDWDPDKARKVAEEKALKPYTRAMRKYASLAEISEALA